MKKLLSLIKTLSAGTQLISVYSKKSRTCLPLRQLVNQVMIDLLPRNLQQKNFIVNDVEKGILVNNPKNILTNVISCLLSTAIVYTNHNCIHISANLSGNTTWLHIKTTDTCHDRAITNRLRHVNLMTEKIDGCITVTNNKVSGTTLDFNFRNREAV